MSMATVDAGKQETILHYLSVEGFSAGAITSLRADIVTYLVSNGHVVDMKKTPLKAWNPKFFEKINIFFKF